MKLTYMLLTSTAIASASLAYGQVISTAKTDAVVIDSVDSELIITEAGSITVNPISLSTLANNAITVVSPQVATIQNNGVISITYNQESNDQPYNLSNHINGIDDFGGSSTIINEGSIQTNLSLANAVTAHTSSSYSYYTETSNITQAANGIYGDVDSNMGSIQTNFSLTDISYSNITMGTEEAWSEIISETNTDLLANGIIGDVGNNIGSIRTNLNIADISVYAEAITTTQGYADNYSSANNNFNIRNSANGIIGNLDNNAGFIRANMNITNLSAKSLANGSTSSVTIGHANSQMNTDQSANGILGNLNINIGIIQANTHIFGTNVNTESIGSSATSTTKTYISTTANGVLGDLKINEGIIQTNANIFGGESISKAPGSNSASTNLRADFSGNGVYGDLGTNNGTIAAYLSLTPNTVNGAKGTTTNTYSGNGVVLTNSSTETAVNTGSIIASNYAIAATAARNVDNYGTLVGTGITDANVTATNYGTYILIDANGNILSIDNTAAGATINGKTSEQAAMVGTTDSYNIYTSETTIADAIINGAGVANGVVTLQGTDDFTITNSSLNAYHTALDIQTNNRVDASDTYFNGGGLLGNKNIEYNATDIPVIKGDDQDNILIVRGNSYINGDVAFGDGADIFVLDIENTTLNGTADLGDADDDTFALYTFTGNQDELRTATQDYASWGMFNAYFGDKVLNFENIGAEVGTITMTDDLTDYGLYIGKKATADFTTNDSYTLKNLRNDGLVNLSDDAVGGHITVRDYLKGTGTYIFDTDFTTLKSDYITVNGDVTANSIIAINDVTGATSTQKGKILLIEAPNDSNKSDEDFNLALANQYNDNSKQGRFTGSPYVWALANSGNDWVLTTIIPDNPVPPTPTIVAEIPAYTSLPTIGREIVMDELGTLHTRLGELRNNQGWVGTGASNLKTNLGSEWHNTIGFDDSQANAWLKGTISHFDIGADNSFDVSGTYGGFNLGIDKKFDLGNHSPDWSVFTGLFGGYKTGSFETSGKGNQYTSNEHADIDIDAWSIGGYATFFNTAGTYIDLVAEYMDLSADIDAAGLNSSTNGYALAGSIEVGHSFDLAKDWIIEPQAQVKLAHIHWDDFNDSVNDVSFEDHTYITGRAGVRIEKTIKSSVGEIKPWAYIGVLHEFSDAPEVTYANTIFEAVDYSTAGEIKLGITADVYKSTQLYSNIGYATDFSDYNSIKGDLGLRITW